MLFLLCFRFYCCCCCCGTLYFPCIHLESKTQRPYLLLSGSSQFFLLKSKAGCVESFHLPKTLRLITHRGFPKWWYQISSLLFYFPRKAETFSCSEKTHALSEMCIRLPTNGEGKHMSHWGPGWWSRHSKHGQSKFNTAGHPGGCWNCASRHAGLNCKVEVHGLLLTNGGGVCDIQGQGAVTFHLCKMAGFPCGKDADPIPCTLC